VKKLQRTQIGKIKLGELKPGKWRTLNAVEIKTLMTKI
jgi:16S rRNA U516 pseudouridylate synthase RsuA-like enzyme